MRGLEDDNKRAAGSDSEDDESPDKLDANERRKRFLTMSNLKRVFRTLDLGEDGYIDVEELFEAQKRIGGKLSRREVSDALWEVDDNMTGRLSLNDYLTTYKRSQIDESGFEPKRFFSIVEFLLMDRDCSGEISLDEAMTTLFERQGADDLAAVTKQFFEAAGVGAGGEPPPGATVNFMGYYSKVGRAKPLVPTKDDLRRSWSTELRVRSGAKPPPTTELSKSKSSSVLLPSLVDAQRAADLAAKGPPPGRIVAAPKPPKSGKSADAARPSTTPAPATSATSILGPASSGGGSPPLVNVFTRGPTGKRILDSLKSPSSPGGLQSLSPVADTQGLAASALTFTGKKAALSNNVKQQASNVLRLQPDVPEGRSPPRRPASELSSRRRDAPPSLTGVQAGGSLAAMA